MAGFQTVLNRQQDARLAPGYFPPGPSISNPKNPEKDPKNFIKNPKFRLETLDIL